ncbi:MAG TPA: uracil-DNA glycosylase [Rhodocyclaceae bacterium]|nr:uracil-DNA glycosylase [Rhodocyclaceae bacterium]
MSARRHALLREMGLAPIWRLRGTGGDAGGDDALGAVEGPPAPDAVAATSGLAAGDIRRAPTAAAASSVGAAPVPPRRAAETPGPVAAASPPEDGAARPVASQDAAARAARIAALDWDALEADIRACTACRLCEQRKQAVPGVGDRQADWMFVGEGPGAEEDRRGEPFVGPAGKLLDAMLAAIGLERGEGVYIANAVKCRPPFNRTPAADEIAACLPYLERQIELIRPRVLVALGRPAAQALLGTDVRINAARGQVFAHRGIPVVVTYHPAYLLRNQADKGKAWQDLCFARRVVAEAAKS